MVFLRDEVVRGILFEIVFNKVEWNIRKGNGVVVLFEGLKWISKILFIDIGLSVIFGCEDFFGGYRYMSGVRKDFLKWFIGWKVEEILCWWENRNKVRRKIFKDGRKINFFKFYEINEGYCDFKYYVIEVRIIKCLIFNLIGIYD